LIEITTVRDSGEIGTVASLAKEIWYEYYVPVIGRAQVDYMVPRFQSAAAIREQIAGGLEYYLIAAENAPAGYIAIQRQPTEQALFISKLYIRKSVRGRGLARCALSFLVSLCRRESLKLIWLTVNKRNPAIETYKRLGFRHVADVVTDIGDGFVMDDYRMEKLVED